MSPAVDLVAGPTATLITLATISATISVTRSRAMRRT